jgi:acyl transferase domain-containing protein
MLSARSEPMLREMAKRLAQAMRDRSTHSAGQWCRSVNGSQRDLAFKASLHARDREDLLSKLKSLAIGSDATGVAVRRSNPKQSMDCVVIFDGKSAFVAREAEALAISNPIFSDAYRTCRQMGELAMMNMMLAGDAKAEAALQAFAMQYAAARMLMAAGTNPVAILAEGVGVLVGACSTGILALNDAIDALCAWIKGTPDALARIAHIAPAPVATARGETWRCPLFAAQSSDVVEIGRHSASVVAALSDVARLAVDALASIRRPQLLAIHLGGDESIRARLGATSDDAWADLNTGDTARSRMLGLYAQAYLHGLRFDPAPLSSPGARRVPLPSYPFENKPYRFKSVEFAAHIGTSSSIEATATLPVGRVPISAPLAAKAVPAPISMIGLMGEGSGLAPMREPERLTQAERDASSLQLRKALSIPIAS